MEYLHAALLLHAAGKEISADNITKIFKAVGLSPDATQIRALIAALQNVDITEAIKSGPTFTAALEPKSEPKAEPKVEPPPDENIPGLEKLFG